MPEYCYCCVAKFENGLIGNDNIHRWYLSVLVILSVVFTCYRLCTLFFDQLRFALIYAKVDDISEKLGKMTPK